MTAKERAQELVDRFIDHVSYPERDEGEWRESAKEIATICVEEILLECKREMVDFYIDVKKEIQLL